MGGGHSALWGYPEYIKEVGVHGGIDSLRSYPIEGVQHIGGDIKL